jgi:hypothetical protein
LGHGRRDFVSVRKQGGQRRQRERGRSHEDYFEVFVTHIFV